MQNAMTIPGDNVYAAYGRATAQREGRHLRFAKGDYLAGPDGDEIAEGTELVAIVNQLVVGWTRWHDGKPAEERTGLLAEGFRPARREDLGDTDRSLWPADEKGEPRDPWQFGNKLPLVDRENGETLLFSTSSRGGLNAISKLTVAYGKHVQQAANEGYAPSKLPVVALEVDSYNHSNKAYGRIKFPVLRIVSWVDAESVGQSGADAVDAGYPEERRRVTAQAPAEFHDDSIPF